MPPQLSIRRMVSGHPSAFNHTRLDLCGRKWKPLILPGNRNSLLETYQRCTDGRAHHCIETRCNGKKQRNDLRVCNRQHFFHWNQNRLLSPRPHHTLHGCIVCYSCSSSLLNTAKEAAVPTIDKLMQTLRRVEGSRAPRWPMPYRRSWEM